MSSMFVSPSDPILRTKAIDIEPHAITSPETQAIIKTMYDVAYPEQKDDSRPILVGLAAPQIGINKRIILVDIGADGRGEVSQLNAYINPQIVWMSDETEEWYEGCYSTGRVCGVVRRPKEILVNAYLANGTPFEGKFVGYVARIFQHEIDHLDGSVFVDKITDDRNLHWVEPHEFPAYRNNEGWRNWPKKCSREQWKAIQHGAL